MKTAAEIEDARVILRQLILNPGLSPAQAGLLCGMLNALVWVADGPAGSTMDRVLAGEPLASRQDDSHAMAFLARVREAADGAVVRH